MESFANNLSRTLSLSNEYLMLLLEERGIDGLAPSHGDILAELFKDGSMSMSELSRRIARKPSTVTALVKKLVGMGLACTGKGDADRRQTMVWLTDRGKELERDFAEVSQLLNEPWHDSIVQEDLACASDVLKQVRENLRARIARQRILALSRQDDEN